MPTGIRSVTSKSMDVLAITAQSHQIFHKGTSPKVGKNPPRVSESERKAVPINVPIYRNVRNDVEEYTLHA